MHFIFISSIFHLYIITVNSDNVTDIPLSNNTAANIQTPVYDFLQGKNKTFFDCALIGYEPGEFELFPNGTAYIEISNLTINEASYLIINDTLLHCPSFPEPPAVDKDHMGNSAAITLVGVIISMICIFLHLIAFTFVPDMRNLPGWNLAALCTSLLLSYILMITIVTADVTDIKDVCVAVASLTHFFLLSSFLWMSIMSFDLFMSLLRATGSLKTSRTQFKLKKFAMYSMFVFGIALIFTVLGILANVLEGIPELYKPEFEERCWFNRKTPLLIFFAAPTIALVCLNFIFFALSAYVIHTNKMKSDKDDCHSSLRRRYFMYFRLSVIMGVTWTVGVIAPIVNTDWLWYIFVALNSLQGLYIFLAFTCSKKVKNFLRKKFPAMGNRRPSEQTLSPTFQSYCFYANSIEKDLDKIVDKNKEKTETIVIHL